MLCPKCNSNIPDNAMFCGICGEKLEETKPKLEKNTKIILIVCSVIAALSIIAGIVVLAIISGGSSDAVAEVENEEKETVKTIPEKLYDTMTDPIVPNPDNMPDGEVSDDEKLIGIEEDEIINVLILGVDVEAGLTDVIMVCQIDGKEDEVTLLSIPRDTKIKLNGKNVKINSSYLYGGVDKITDAVEDLTDLEIDYYALLNTKCFRDVIDDLGGVYYTVPCDMNYEDPLQDLYIHLKKGYQFLDGDKAEQLIRFRQYPNGDIGRIATQHDFLKELIDQKLNEENLDKIPKIYSDVSKNTSTDMSPTDLVSIGKMVLEMDQDDFNFIILPGASGYSGDVSYYFADSDCKDYIAEYFD